MKYIAEVNFLLDNGVEPVYEKITDTLEEAEYDLSHLEEVFPGLTSPIEAPDGYLKAAKLEMIEGDAIWTIREYFDPEAQ